MSEYDMIQRAKWHNRRALAFPVSYPHSDPWMKHHLRCFVLLRALARGEMDEFNLWKGTIRP